MSASPAAAGPPSRGPAVLLFDLDGTLTDNFDGISRSILHALACLGVLLPEGADLRSCVGPPLRAVVRAAPRHRRSGADRSARWRATATVTPTRAGARMSVCDGVAEAVAALAAAGAVLHVCTSKPQPYAERIVAHFGLAPHFASVYGADLAGTLDDKAKLSPICSRANASIRPLAR